MKVTDTSQIKALAPGKPTEPTRPTELDRPDASDRVTTDAREKVAEAVAQASVSASAGRSAKLAAIESQVRQGTYRPSPQAIAQQILDDAELAARLQAIFSR